MNITWLWLGFLRKLGISLLFFLTCSHAGVPLPGQDGAQNKGLTAGMGFGTLNSTSCRTLWTWAGHGSYSYNSYLSAGASIKFLGGNLDSANNLINQRYSVNAKITHKQPNYALFVGPVFSFENTDLSALRKEFSSIGGDDDRTDTKCSESYAEIGSSIGYKSGLGFLATPNWGFSFGHNLDLTFRGIFIASFSSAIAFNLREQFEKLTENTENFWLSLEYSTSLSRNSTYVHNIILGLTVGF
jgi:hypothetical protein